MFLMAANSRVPEKVALVKLITDKNVRRALAENPEEYLAVKGDAVEATLQEWVENNMSSIENLGLIQLAKFLVNPDRIASFSNWNGSFMGLSHASVEPPLARPSAVGFPASSGPGLHRNDAALAAQCVHRGSQ